MTSRCRSDDGAGLRRRRAHLARLFVEGKAEAAFALRLMLCVTASQCGRLCRRLVKGPGTAGPRCVDIQTGASDDLYACLQDPAFACPEDRF